MEWGKVMSEFDLRIKQYDDELEKPLFFSLKRFESGEIGLFVDDYQSSIIVRSNILTIQKDGRLTRNRFMSACGGNMPLDDDGRVELDED